MALSFDRPYARPFLQACKVDVSERAVFLESAGVKIDAVFNAVGIAFFFERLHQCDLFADEFGSARKTDSAAVDTKRVKIGEERFRHRRNDLADGSVLLR